MTDVTYPAEDDEHLADADTLEKGRPPQYFGEAFGIAEGPW